jgi:hypothetical protein
MLGTRFGIKLATACGDEAVMGEAGSDLNGAKLSLVTSQGGILECGGLTPFLRDRLDGRGVARPVPIESRRDSASSRAGEKRRQAAALHKLFGLVIAFIVLNLAPFRSDPAFLPLRIFAPSREILFLPDWQNKQPVPPGDLYSVTASPLACFWLTGWAALDFCFRSKILSHRFGGVLILRSCFEADSLD